MSRKIHNTVMHTMMHNYLHKNDSKYDDEFEDDIMDFEYELETQDKYVDYILNANNNKQNIVIDNEISGVNGLMNLIVNDHENNYRNMSYELNNKDQKQIITIRRTENGDTITTIYLEVELEENMTFNELTNSDKLQLFDICFDFTIGGSYVFKTTILTNLLMLFSQDVNIKLEGNKFQIPLLDFTKANIIKYSNNGMNDINLREEDIGFPLCHLLFHDVRIGIDFRTKNLFTFMKFKIMCCCKYLDIEQRKPIMNSPLEYLFLESFWEESDNLDVVRIYGRAVKIIVLYYKPLVNDYIDYPEIESIEVTMDDNTLSFDKSELLSMELYDMCYTVIPLTSDFSSWKNINRTLKNPKKYMSSHCIHSDHFKLNIDYTFKPDNFDVCVNCISINIFRFLSGMGGRAFSS